MNGRLRSSVKQGLTVDIVLKKDQATGRLTRGIVKDILTHSANHPHGIKVRLQDGQIGRVKAIITNSPSEAEKKEEN
ncbi:YwbE family protein [Paenibacillus ihumii]|uniref:YwbE family protein n=1 Tax=Paenibacillus ihumii TaxID=687436 RepID=UPI0006D78A6E|nr:YwbE family protein [Paenibacillus ihumii]